MLRGAISQSKPTAIAAGVIHIAVDDDMLLEGLERKRQLVEGVLGEFIDGLISVRISSGTRRNEVGEGASKRQTAVDDREARLRTYRAQDPSLDAMAEALDLELRE
jgi:hypothetical protein